MTSEVPSFELATTSLPGGRPGTYVADLSSQWCVMGKPNGGYLAATMIRAAVTELELQGYDHPDCMAATSTYLGAPDPKEASIQVSVLRGGRGISQVRVVLEQDGVAMVESQLVLSKHKGQDRLYDSLPRPAATEPESCVRAVAGDGPQERRIAIMEGTEVLMDPATTVFDRGFDNGVAEIRGWASFADGRAIDGPALHYLIDCLPPATFVFQRAGWVPTLQLTGYLRSHPAPGPVLIRQRAQVIESGFVDEVCEIWDSDGRLVAQGTQLAKVRFA